MSFTWDLSCKSGGHMKNLTMNSESSGRWSPRRSLLIVVVGAAVGWVAAIVSVYGIMRSLDGEALLGNTPTTIASEEDGRTLNDIAPASGQQADKEDETARP